MTRTWTPVDALEVGRDSLELLQRVGTGEHFEILHEGRAVTRLIPVAPAQVQGLAEDLEEGAAPLRREGRPTPQELRAWIDEGKR